VEGGAAVLSIAPTRKWVVPDLDSRTLVTRRQVEEIFFTRDSGNFPMTSATVLSQPHSHLTGAFSFATDAVECFRIIGEKPGKTTGQLQETFLEDFRKEVAEVQSPVAKRLFVLAKLNHLAHLRIAEYEVLLIPA
jgi:hypothetical protein